MTDFSTEELKARMMLVNNIAALKALATVTVIKESFAALKADILKSTFEAEMKKLEVLIETEEMELRKSIMTNAGFPELAEIQKL